MQRGSARVGRIAAIEAQPRASLRCARARAALVGAACATRLVGRAIGTLQRLIASVLNHSAGAFGYASRRFTFALVGSPVGSARRGRGARAAVERPAAAVVGHPAIGAEVGAPLGGAPADIRIATSRAGGWCWTRATAIEHRSALVGDHAAVLSLHHARGGCAAAMIGRSASSTRAGRLARVAAIEHLAAAVRCRTTLGVEIGAALGSAWFRAAPIGTGAAAHIGA